MSGSGLVTHNPRAIQEQQVEIGVLKKRLKVLEAENAKLTAIVSKVESLEQAIMSLRSTLWQTSRTWLNGLRTKTALQPVAFNQ